MKTMLRITVLLLLCLVLCLGQTAFAEEANASSASLTIPKNTTVIESEAFAGCRNITSVTIPASVTRIEDGAFTAARPWKVCAVKIIS